MPNIDTAKTPFRRLQERVQELEKISKVHQEQNGKLMVELQQKDSKIKQLEKQIEDIRVDSGGWVSK
jgi:hypothetical protein